MGEEMEPSRGREGREDAPQTHEEMDRLNRELSALLGIGPRKTSWEIFSKDESSTCFSCEMQHQAEAWLADVLKRHPDSWLKDYHVGSMDHWHRFCNSWDGVQVLIEALEAQGWSWWLEGSTNCPKTATVGEWKATANTVPMALAIAAKAALSAEAERSDAPESPRGSIPESPSEAGTLPDSTPTPNGGPNG